MAADRPWELSMDGLEVRRIERAGLLLQAETPDNGRRTVIVQDADSGSFVRVPCTPTDARTDAIALSRDGRRMAYLSSTASGHGRELLVVHLLADGTEARFDAETDGSDLRAGFSPDGRSLAVLSADQDRGPDDRFEADLLIVSLIDLVTGDRRRLWSGPGLAPAERAISWSPDGHFIAIVHLDVDETCAITVLDSSTGRLVTHFTEMEALDSSQGSWFSEQELVMFPEDVDYDETPRAPALIVDVVSGTTRRIDQTEDLPDGCIAVGNGRMIGPFPPHGIGTAALDGSNPRLLLTHEPTIQVTVVDIAPDASPLP
ncbi:hypothetical protein G3I60_08945 [Streptomyces sp. SID13666]|uniref:TolB family protein n=1 Tax=unclassified Streptomyces TaxID=2593676 RepID=UPI0013BEC2CE|nr:MULTISPECIES: PD40 domain-containing protein [unclassified Streptomyces]NEA54274.1 hypothetical protein [Streptomyces sp. SID13666]NEA70369.1 hypothetical protein [Streptomyces sp. SID13588]